MHICNICGRYIQEIYFYVSNSNSASIPEVGPHCQKWNHHSASSLIDDSNGITVVDSFQYCVIWVELEDVVIKPVPLNPVHTLPLPALPRINFVGNCQLEERKCSGKEAGCFNYNNRRLFFFLTFPAFHFAVHLFTSVFNFRAIAVDCLVLLLIRSCDKRIYV